MDNVDFAKWVSVVGLLNAAQRSQTLRELALAEAAAEPPVANTAAAPSAVAAATAPPETVEAAADAALLAKVGRARIDSFGCPHCGEHDVCGWGRANGKPRYRCAKCGKTFNAVTGTPLAGLHYPDRWADQAQALIEGETLAKAALRCRIDPTTAFRWRHRFLSALNRDKPDQLCGIVEADETFILESCKGKRGALPRKSRTRGGCASQRGLSAEQIPVLIARDRTGATTDAVLPHLDAASIAVALEHVITRPAELCCDGGAAITAYARRTGVKFHVLPAPGGPLPEAPQFHINNVNAYHSRLKEWLRRFHGVATKNLPSYLSWRRTIEALAATSAPPAWIMGAAGLGPYQQRLR